MFKITNNIINVLNKNSQDIFIKRMINHLHQIYNLNINENDIELRQLIVKIIDEAKDYNIIYEADLERYIELYYCFDELKQVSKYNIIENILYHPTASAEVKIDILYKKLISNEIKIIDDSNYNNDTLELIV